MAENEPQDPNTVERFGRPLNLLQHPLTAPREQGFLSAAGRAWDMAWKDTKHRWRSMDDESPLIPPERFKEIVGERQVSYDRGMTEETATFLANEYDDQQYAQQYQSRPVVEFAGALLPSLPEPVNLATMPIGGTRFAAAMGSKTIKEFAGNMAVGGLKVATATVPAEAAMQQEAYGEVRPEMLGLAALVPFVAPTVLSTPALALRGLTRGRTARAVAESPGTSPFDDIEGASRAIDEQGGTTPISPTPRQEPAPPAPSARLNQMFSGFDGGADGWVRAMSAGSKLAREFAEGRGIDPDQPALKAFFRAEGYRNAWTGLPKPGQVIGTMQKVAQGEASKDLSAELIEAGIMTVEEGQPRVRAPFRAVMEALANPDADQAPLRQFMNEGPERVAAAFAESAQRRANQAFEADLDPDARLSQLTEAVRDLEDAGTRPMPIRGEYSRENLLNALDAARLEAPVRDVPPTQAAVDLESTVPQTDVDDVGADGGAEKLARRETAAPDEQQVRDFAQAKGIDTADTDRMVDGVLEKMMRCGQ